MVLRLSGGPGGGMVGHSMAPFEKKLDLDGNPGCLPEGVISESALLLKLPRGIPYVAGVLRVSVLFRVM